MPKAKTTIKLSVKHLPRGESLPASIDHQRAICGIEFDARGHHVNPGPATDHLNDADMQALCGMLTDAALDLLQLDNPTHGVLYVYAASRTDIQAFYMPHGVITYRDHDCGTLH